MNGTRTKNELPRMEHEWDTRKTNSKNEHVLIRECEWNTSVIFCRRKTKKSKVNVFTLFKLSIISINNKINHHFFNSVLLLSFKLNFFVNVF